MITELDNHRILITLILYLHFSIYPLTKTLALILTHFTSHNICDLLHHTANLQDTLHIGLIYLSQEKKVSHIVRLNITIFHADRPGHQSGICCCFRNHNHKTISI